MKSFSGSKKTLSLFPFLLVFYEISNYLANDMYLPALPQITADLHTTVQAAQQTLTVFFLGTASLQLFLGPLSDRLGRRPIFFAGGFIFILSTAFCILATHIHTLLIARFFQGCAVCFIVTAGYSTVHEIYDHIKAIQILAIMTSIIVLAPAFGPLLGSFVLEWGSWQWIFGLLLIWACIALLALWFLMPESNPKEKRLAFNWKNVFHHYRFILGNVTFMRNMLIWCFTFLGMIAWVTAGPFLVITQFHFNARVFGIFQAMIFGCLIIGSAMVNRVIAKVGVERLISWGLIFVLLGGFLAFCLTLFFPHFLFGLIISLMIFTFGGAILASPLNRIAIEACTEPMGMRMAISSTLMNIFGFIGGLLVGLTYTGTLLWFGVLLFVIAGVVGLIRISDKKVSDFFNSNKGFKIIK